jgi:type II secretory pathway pseudopilin PulG
MRCEVAKPRTCEAAKRQPKFQLALRFCDCRLLHFLRPRLRFRNEKGYTLAVVAVFTTVLLVTLSAAVLNWQKARQREREEELIFRGKQFMRAIELWQRKFPGTYPTTIDALLSTSNTRFLRKKWKDPITNSDDWRLIKMNPDGSVSGLTIIPGSNPLGPSAFGSPTTGRGAGSSGQAQGAAGASSRIGISQGSRPVQTGLQTGQGQSAFNPVLGGIVGVASKSEKESLKAYNGKSKYNEWEFYFVGRAPGPGAPPVQRPGASPVQQPQAAPRPGGIRSAAPPQNPQR